MRFRNTRRAQLDAAVAREILERKNAEEEDDGKLTDDEVWLGQYVLFAGMKGPWATRKSELHEAICKKRAQSEDTEDLEALQEKLNAQILAEGRKELERRKREVAAGRLPSIHVAVPPQ